MSLTEQYIIHIILKGLHVQYFLAEKQDRQYNFQAREGDERFSHVFLAQILPGHTPRHVYCTAEGRNTKEGKQNLQAS